MCILKNTRRTYSTLLVVYLLWWCSPAWSLDMLLGSNLSVGDRHFANQSFLDHSKSRERESGFQVWLYEYLQITVKLHRGNLSAQGKKEVFEFCVNSNHDASPVHVGISINTRIINYEKRSVSKYSFGLAADQGWRNSRDYFDFLISSGKGCSDQNRIILASEKRWSDQMDYIDTITLTIRPE